MTLGSGSGDFIVGETVTQTVNTGKTVSGNVVSYSSVSANQKTLKVNNITYSDDSTQFQIRCLYCHQIQMVICWWLQ